jgi:predicted transposase/invertase (TIGR01784 family)
MQPDPDLYYRIHNELATYLKQYQPPNPWTTLVIYPNEATECKIPHLERFLAFANLHRIYLNQIPPGLSFGMDLLRLVVAPPEEVPQTGRDLVEQLKEFEPSFSQKCLELVTELVSRKFPDITEEEIERMLGLAQLEQTRPYQQGFEIGVQTGEASGEKKARTAVAISLLRAGMSIDQVATHTGLSVEAVEKIQKQME